mgnify:CR=1 FL=1
MNYPESLSVAIRLLSKLPGIGKKTAERLAFNLVKSDKEYVRKLSSSLEELKLKIKDDPSCGCMTDLDTCKICGDPSRNSEIICVVKEQQDVFHIEKSGFRGLYHVLGGLISPLDGINPENLNIDTLIKRLNDVGEIIMAIDPSNEGDITILYLTDIIKKENIKISRLARGIPVGSSLEFIDEVTLTYSINDRVEMK